MGRKPDVFVRPLFPEEGRRVARIAKTSKVPVRARRAIVVMASAQRQPVGLIAKLMQVSEPYVRQVIHDFNEHGFGALDPKWSGGRPSKTDPKMRERICQIARCCPLSLGWPFSTWSLSKLWDVLVLNGIVDISRETLRQILKAGGVSWQATKTWKASNDPDFAAKMARVLELYDNPPADGRVVCVDEFGPLNLQPRAGRGWFPRRRPNRLRAPYNRTQGVRHMFGGLDLATGLLYYRIRDRKRWTEFLAFLTSLRARWPGDKLYLILDNYSVHKRREVREWCVANAVELVFVPAYSSWLNRIECEFAALRYFALNGTDHRSHDEQDTAIGNYIRWRNQHAGPIRDFAVGSKIRHPDYLTNVA
ncbi:IS630 family transposase [Nocardia mangyaensis]|uniref:IS630 family transposase n=1 Tax=Nocardia mangyaensis TaxID=2213200 RepID=UPI000A59F7F9|nr:IS630 family transposase [Nocardia mangyaensis]